MPPTTRVSRLFLNDAFALLKQAQAALKEIHIAKQAESAQGATASAQQTLVAQVETASAQQTLVAQGETASAKQMQAAPGETQAKKPGSGAAAEKVAEFYRHVHSLKGTASMVEGGDEISRQLEAIEAILASRSYEQNARMAESWAKTARSALESVGRSLKRFEAIVSSAGLQESASERGYVITVPRAEGADEWFLPISSILRIFVGGEVIGRKQLILNGEWVPVFGAESSGSSRFGVAIELPEGRVVLRASAISRMRLAKAESAPRFTSVSDLVRDRSRDSAAAA